MTQAETPVGGFLSNPAAEFIETQISEITPALDNKMKFVATLDKFVDDSKVPR
jgi:hypothetical protein